MKKIQLTDGMPVDIKVNEQSEEVIHLLEQIIKMALKSGLSYVDMNKALYLADKGLYERTISKAHSPFS